MAGPGYVSYDVRPAECVCCRRAGTRVSVLLVDCCCAPFLPLSSPAYSAPPVVVVGVVLEISHR